MPTRHEIQTDRRSKLAIEQGKVRTRIEKRINVNFFLRRSRRDQTDLEHRILPRSSVSICESVTIDDLDHRSHAERSNIAAWLLRYPK